jgi:hypothetical protein
MNPKDHMIAKELKDRLSDLISPVDIIVFGSGDRGSQGEYADLDISKHSGVISIFDKEFVHSGKIDKIFY